MNTQYIKKFLALCAAIALFQASLFAEEEASTSTVTQEEVQPETAIPTESEKILPVEETAPSTQVAEEAKTPAVLQISSETVQADVKRSMGYVSINVGPLPVPVPMASFGYRAQSNHNGVDFGVDIPNFVFLLRGYVNYLYYINPSLEDQWYVGLGVTYEVGIAFYTKYPAPQFLFGNEYKTKGGKTRFWEIGAQVPSLLKAHWVDGTDKHKDLWKAPFIYFRYGFCF